MKLPASFRSSGNRTVNKVFDQFIAIAGITASTKAEAKAAAAKQQNVFMRAIKLLGDIFVPIIPAIVPAVPDGDHEFSGFYDQ